MVRPGKSRSSGFVILCSQTKRWKEMAKVEVLCGEGDKSGLSVSWDKGPVKTGGGRCIERLRVSLIGSRVHILMCYRAYRVECGEYRE